MPLEISEIGIHMAVGGPGPAGAAAPGQGAGPSGPEEAAPQPDTEQIVQRCVAEVMRVMRQREAR